MRRQRKKYESDRRYHGIFKAHNRDRKLSETEIGLKEGAARHENLYVTDTPATDRQGPINEVQISYDGEYENEYVNSPSDVQMSEYENLDTYKTTMA